MSCEDFRRELAIRNRRNTFFCDCGMELLPEEVEDHIQTEHYTLERGNPEI